MNGGAENRWPRAQSSERPVPTGGSLATPERPWLGLARFTENEKDYFYGRAAEIAELRDRVLRAPLTVLYGVSGYGKSSLLGAGLIPALRAENLLPIALPRFAFDDPKCPPVVRALEEIRNALRTADSAAQSLAINGPPNSLWEFFHDRSVPCWQPSNPAYVQPVLIFDQFEDIFTQGEDKGGACTTAGSEFLTAIADLVENRPPVALRERMRNDRALVRAYDFQSRPVKLVIALREDFLARLERWRRVLPSVVENRVELRLLSGIQALRAVLEPARKRIGKPPIIGGHTGAAIVRFVAGVAADVPLEEIDNVPPLLSLICAQLNERRFSSLQAEVPNRDDIPIEWVRAPRSTDRTLVAARADAMEVPRTAAEEVLEDFYIASFAEHPGAVRRFVEDELVSAAGFREAVTLDTALNDLRAAGVSQPRAALDRLVDQRLLTIEDHGGVARVEFTHDILAALALRSRETRKEQDAIAAKKAAEAARAEEEHRRAEAERLREHAMLARRRARQLALLASFIALGAIAALFSAMYARRETDRQRSIAVQLKEQALAEKANAEQQRAEAESQRHTAQAARKLAEEREAGARAAEAQARAAEQTKNQLLLKTIPYRLCSVLAINDPETTEDFWAPMVAYYQYGWVSRAQLIAQHRRDNRQYPFRNYTVTTTPTVSDAPGNDGWIIKFGMNYTLLDQQRRPATGELDITLSVDRDYRVTQISQEVVKARKK
jgi:hypothetical protein